MSADQGAIHPELPGDATIGSMVRAFAPFTRGRRRVFAVGVALSLVLFGLTAWLPLLTGSLLETALSRAHSSNAIRQYTSDSAALVATTADVYARTELSEDETALVAEGVQATADRALALHGDAVLDALFPAGLTYSTAGAIEQHVDRAFGTKDEPWMQRVRSLVADGRLTRSEVEALHPPSGSVDVDDGDRAFTFSVGMLAEDPAAVSQRTDAQNHDLIVQLVLFAGVVLAVLVLRWVTASISFSFTTWSARRLQDAVFEQVSDSYVVDSGALGRPSMISRCTSYVDKVEMALMKAQTVGVQALAGVVLSLALVVWIDVPTGLLMIGVVLVFEVLRRVLQGRWSAVGHRRLDASTRLSEVTDDAITAAGEVRVADASWLERRRFAAMADTVRADTISLARFGEGFALAALTIAQIGIVITVVVIGFARNDLSIAAATATLLYVRTLGESIASIPGVLVDLHEAAPYMRRIERVLLGAKRHSPSPASPRTDAALAPGSLQVQSASWSPPDGSPGCVAIDIVVARGERRFVVGGSASVRDAIAAVASGLEIPDDGSVALGEVDLASSPYDVVRRSIGVIARDPVVLAASLRDNVRTLCPEASDDDVMVSLARVGLDELVERLPHGLDELVGRGGRRLSLAERNSLGIARVLLADPIAVVLDDPWGELDPVTRSEKRDLVWRCFPEVPVLVITSDPSLPGEGDPIDVLDGQSIAASGTRAELLTSDRRFRALWERTTDSAFDVELLASVPSLAGLDDSARSRLASRMVTQRFDGGEEIFAPGDVADALYVVVEGSVVLSDGGRRVATIGRGDHFGDLDAAGVHVRTVSAHALTPTVVHRLHRLTISEGVFGQLDRSPIERSVVRLLTREGARSRDEVAAIGDGAVEALAALVADGTVVVIDDADGTRFRMAGSLRRAPQSALAARSLLEQLIAD